MDIIKPEQYGAVGNGVDNDTDPLQNAIDVAASCGACVELTWGKTYMIVPTITGSGVYVGLKLPSRTILSMHRAQIISPSIQGDEHQILQSIDTDDVIISGGSIIGDLDPQSPSGASGVGVAFWGCRNAVISGVSISRCRGDGVYVRRGTPQNESAPTTKSLIDRCYIHDCSRQGISVVCADGLHITCNEVENIRGNNPQSGIDLEPSTGHYVRDVVIDKNRIRSVDGPGIVAQGDVGPSAFVISRNIVRDAAKESIRIKRSTGFVIENNLVHSLAGETVRVIDCTDYTVGANQPIAG
jgi:polygalacturonase